MQIKLKYIFAFFILFITEILIALFVNDTIIRPYIGDVLVVILLYTLVRGTIRKSIRFLPVYLFFFASIVELAQYYRIVDRLHLQDNKIASIIIGTSFDRKDILCYLIAAMILIVWERIEKSTDCSDD